MIEQLLQQPLQLLLLHNAGSEELVVVLLELPHDDERLGACCELREFDDVELFADPSAGWFGGLFEHVERARAIVVLDQTQILLVLECERRDRTVLEPEARRCDHRHCCCHPCPFVFTAYFSMFSMWTTQQLSRAKNSSFVTCGCVPNSLSLRQRPVITTQLGSMRPRAPPTPSASRFAPVTPLLRADERHYLRRSVIRRSSSQSDSAILDSDLDESDEEAAESSPFGDSDADSDDDSDDSQSDASLGSRNTSRSSLSDSDNSSSEDDGLRKIRIRNHSSSTAMSVPRGGVFCQSDNLGVLALMVPITGVSTMVVTEVLACVNHFDCSKEYPTLSYAAEFKPEGHAFTVGMCTTSLFIQATVLLFHWFLRLKLFHPGANLATVVVTHFCLVSGTIAATSLFGLAVFDMGAYHDIHVNFTVLFFLSAWVMMIAMQIARRNLLRDQDETRPQKKKSLPNDGASAVCLALQRWKHVSLRRAYQVGNGFLGAGLTSTALFGLLYQCVNGKWANPLGFTAVQEALLEAFAILCQLFFMGTLSCELAKLTRVVEHRDYDELERAE